MINIEPHSWKIMHTYVFVCQMPCNMMRWSMMMSLNQRFLSTTEQNLLNVTR